MKSPNMTTPTPVKIAARAVVLNFAVVAPRALRINVSIISVSSVPSIRILCDKLPNFMYCVAVHIDLGPFSFANPLHWNYLGRKRTAQRTRGKGVYANTEELER